MKKCSFELNSDEDLIIIEALVDDYEIRLAIDTAATHTVIDFNVLLMLGYQETNAVKTILVETANGIMNTKIYKINTFSSLFKSKSNFEVISYDFLEKGLLSTYDGVLGLDFFMNNVLTIDFINNEVWLD